MSIACDNVSFAYAKGPDVLSGVTLSIDPGRVTAVLGPNGSGKSTLLRLLAGLRRPRSGRVTIGGEAAHAMNAARRAARVAYIAQRPTLAFDFDVRRVVALGRFRESAAASGAVVDSVLECFGLTELQDRPLGSLSIGQQQRVALARGAAQLEGREHAFLLADEPTSALDPKHQLETLALARGLADRGVGVVLVLHDVSHAARVADRVVMLDASGRVRSDSDTLDEGALEDVFGVRFRSIDAGGTRVLVPGVDA